MGIFLDHASSRRALNACDSISQLIGCLPDGTCIMTLLMISFDVERCTPGVTLGMTLDQLTGKSIYLYQIVFKNKDKWIENHDEENGAVGEWKTNHPITDIRNKTTIPVHTILTGRKVNIHVE